ncbi:hypothetical protein J6590_015778 [Homalodisca vitripennis]|nr:hypothetical protein J6590_096710 [Homalodisca vitripennis]KAG8322787.1 hypothetical protein J6590_015778 [Homalodisca vitripennis]
MLQHSPHSNADWVTHYSQLQTLPILQRRLAHTLLTMADSPHTPAPTGSHTTHNGRLTHYSQMQTLPILQRRLAHTLLKLQTLPILQRRLAHTLLTIADSLHTPAPTGSLTTHNCRLSPYSSADWLTHYSQLQTLPILQRRLAHTHYSQLQTLPILQRRLAHTLLIIADSPHTPAPTGSYTTHNCRLSPYSSADWLTHYSQLQTLPILQRRLAHTLLTIADHNADSPHTPAPTGSHTTHNCRLSPYSSADWLTHYSQLQTLPYSSADWLTHYSQLQTLPILQRRLAHTLLTIADSPHTPAPTGSHTTHNCRLSPYSGANWLTRNSQFPLPPYSRFILICSFKFFPN